MVREHPSGSGGWSRRELLEIVPPVGWYEKRGFVFAVEGNEYICFYKGTEIGRSTSYPAVEAVADAFLDSRRKLKGDK